MRGGWAPSQGALGLRIATLSLAVAFVQIGILSEVTIFGVNVELAPLLAAFVGLLCGSVPGAVAGFGIGLLMDLALVQTLGITSLLLTLTGFWAGRLREVRDPQAAIVPIVVGAAAASFALVGYAVIEFLLGVDAPVSLQLLRDIVLGVVVDTIAALPFYLIVRRALQGSMPEDQRRRRRSRRAYSTGGLSPISRMR
jgi:rod shape-determining protein MreD